MIHIPGHTPGSIGLLEKDAGILYVGEFIDQLHSCAKDALSGNLPAKPIMFGGTLSPAVERGGVLIICRWGAAG